jgi:hypothetical protein
LAKVFFCSPDATRVAYRERRSRLISRFGVSFGEIATSAVQRKETFTTGSLRVSQLQHFLESGKVQSLTAIAMREGVDNSYVSRIVNLTTLAPDIVDAILHNALPDHLTLFDLAVDPPALWEDQRARMEEG